MRLGLRKLAEVLSSQESAIVAKVTKDWKIELLTVHFLAN